MWAYSVDLRQRIVEAVKEDGLAKAEVARRFRVSRRTVYRYLELAQRDNLAPRRPPGGERKLKGEALEALRKQLESYDEATLEEHAERFEQEHGVKLAFSTINLYCQRLGISRKKRRLLQKSAMSRNALSGF
jgi:transposase